MPNRLADSSSPYLRQHAENPIDWFPWGPEAFSKAAQEDKPIFLSIGYSACHWCHVMAHESFEDPGVAALLNEKFVSIKVDREELPDVDDAYMTAVQLASGRGGWPMTLFITPDKTPFFAATYLPRESHVNRPGFLDVCRHITSVWENARKEIEEAAAEFRTAIAQARAAMIEPFSGEAGHRLIQDCVDALRSDFDDENAGFGAAPKFPPHTALELLLGEPEGRWMAEKTLEAMVLGGIHDHVGGGFHRYSTDEYWVLPHFEKMLSDNAQLLGPLTQAGYQNVADRVIAWMQRELMSPEGLFYSALDADSEGEEGRYYTWSIAELAEHVSPEFIDAFQAIPMGNVPDEATGERNGRNVLYLASAGSFEPELATLLEVRAKRERPGLDDKCLAGWNGLAIRGLTLAGRRDLAVKCAQVWHALSRMHGELPHLVVNLKPSGSAYLEDYAQMALAIFDLYEAVGDPELLTWARELTSEMKHRFYDPMQRVFLTTSADHEELFGRVPAPLDNATPSASGTAIRCIIRAGELGLAADCLHALSGWMHQAPHATETLHIALRELLALQEGAQGPEVQFRLQEAILEATPTGLVQTLILVDIPPGFHIQSHQPSEPYLIPTAIHTSMQAEFDFPVGLTYEGSTVIRARLKSPVPGPFTLEITYQACSDTECFAPSTAVLEGEIRF